jgi:hypothetical protein
MTRRDGMTCISRCLKFPSYVFRLFEAVVALISTLDRNRPFFPFSPLQTIAEPCC